MKMLVKINIRRPNTDLIKRLLEIRASYNLSRSKTHKACQTEPKDVFKFYSENNENYSDRYKSLSANDYNRFFSNRALKREPALTRLITSLAYKVGKQMVSLAEGMPNEEVFPFSHLKLTLKDGNQIDMEGTELATALQYVPSQGLPPLLTALRDLQTMIHRPPTHSREIIVTNGAQHAIYQCFELLLDPGDPIIMTEYAYTGANVALKPYDPEILGIPEDADGMRSEVLEAILSTRLSKGLKMPKVMYTIPTGNNPTGTVISEERRRHIYELACRYDFLILEDDPYMFLNYGEKQVPSFLSLDGCGRVVRMDSLSKVVAAGLRAGWVTAPAPLVQRLELHAQAELLHSCSLSQTIIHRLISDHASLAKHLTTARAYYHARRDALHRALTAAGVGSVADWHLPDAGLFLWLHVRGVEDVYNMVFQTAFQRGLMLIPGQAFQYESGSISQYVRLTFSKVPMEQMDLAARHLVEIIKNEQANSTSKRAQRFATDR